MRSIGRYAFLTATLVASSFTTTAHAASITTLFGTGVNSAGVALSGGSVDPHWRLVSSPDPDYPGPDALVIFNSAPPIASGDYVPNTATSRWISPRSDGGNNFPRGDCTFGCDDGNYVYETSFDLTGLNLSTVLITGQWAVDDSAEMFLNGQPTGISRTLVPGSNDTYHTFAPFTLTTGFVPGINTLSVVVNNFFDCGCGINPNPTGLHVQLTGDGTIPEPATILLLVASTVALSRTRRGTAYDRS